MGFKYRKFTLTGGSADFPTGNTDALMIQRSKTILSKVADCLLDSGCGWVLDTNRNQATTDYSDVPCVSGSKVFPGLFFRNSISGCKLFIAYFGGSFDSDYVISEFGSVQNLYYISSTPAICGLVCSIIPDGSNSEFGSSFDSSFLPQDATRLVGSCCYGTRTSSYAAAHAYNPESGINYTWGIWTNEYCFGVGSARAASTSSPVYIAGRIFGTLAHDSDNAVNSKYGSVHFRAPGTSPEGWSGDVSVSTTLLGDTLKIPGAPIDSGSINGAFVGGTITKASGAWVNGFGNGYIVYFSASNPVLLATKLFNVLSSSAWVPLFMFVFSSSLTDYGIVSGDGFKGFLDATLFRCALGTRTTLFDNGKFIKVNDSQYSELMLGWDPSNDPI